MEFRSQISEYLTPKLPPNNKPAWAGYHKSMIRFCAKAQLQLNNQGAPDQASFYANSSAGGKDHH